MDLNDLEETLEEIRPDETGEDWGLRLVMAMLGNVSEGLMRTDTIDRDMETAMERSGHDEDEIREAMDMAKRDMFGALFVAVAELADEHSISIDEAVEERVERMRKAKDAKDRVAKWKEAGIIDKDSGQVDTDLASEDDRAFM